MAAAAMATTSSLASQLSSGPKHGNFTGPHFSGPRRVWPSPSSFSSNFLFFQNVRSQIRISSRLRDFIGVVSMAGFGKNGTNDSTSKLICDLNGAKMENDVGMDGLSLKLNETTPLHNALRYDAVIEAKKGNPPTMPAVMTPGGLLDLSSVLFRNRIIFIGQPINSQVAQRAISQLVTLATIDEDADILVYLNCPGGSTYSVLAIYDCMSWIKPKVGTVCFGVAASQGALLLAGGEKGMRYAMPNARIMIHQPQSGCGGHVEDVRRQVNEAVQSRHKVDKMYASFTGQPLEKVQQYTERDRFFSSSEALEFGLIDGVLETEY